MDAREQKIQKLKEYFEVQQDVVMAFLFGSQMKGTMRTASDWDIGVYLADENREREQHIWGDVEQLLQSEVDFVLLNRAPASIAWNIIRSGESLSIKDRSVYLTFMLQVSDEANAWYRTAEEYHHIFQRSASLSKSDRATLERTVQFLFGEIQDYKKFISLTWQEYLSDDRAKKREVERWAEQIINAVIDIAKVVLASERRVIPETYRAMVQTLSTVSPFDNDIDFQQLSSWTELRNVLAHEYLDYRWKELQAFISETEPLMRSLAEKTTAYLDANK